MHPDDDAGVILVPLAHPHAPVHDAVEPGSSRSSLAHTGRLPAPSSAATGCSPLRPSQMQNMTLGSARLTTACHSSTADHCLSVPHRSRGSLCWPHQCSRVHTRCRAHTCAQKAVNPCTATFTPFHTAEGFSAGARQRTIETHWGNENSGRR